jgi:hypothetical protein
LRRRFVAAIGGTALLAVLAGSVFVPTKVQGPGTEVAYMCPPGMHPVTIGGFVFCWFD